MIKNDKQEGTPFIDYTDTKSAIESLSNMRVGAHAIATDNPSAPFGVYVSGGWHWYSTGSAGSSLNFQDEGVPLGVPGTVNFVGSQVSVTVSGTVARVFVTGSSSVSAHNSLTGLQGGTTDEYYHLSSGTYLKVTNSRDVLTADRTYYVRTDGSDSNNGLTNTAGGAFLTIQKAFDVIGTLDKAGFDIVVQVGAGTFAGDISPKVGIGEGTVTLRGTLTSQESVTSATVAAGTGATRGTVTKTGQFTGNSYENLLAYFVTDAVYRVIHSHTNDVLTLIGTAASSTTQNVEIYSWGTIISGDYVGITAPVNIEYIDFTGGLTFQFQSNGVVSCVRTVVLNIFGGSSVYFLYSVLSTTATSAGQIIQGSAVDFQYSKLILNNNSCSYLFNLGASGYFRSGSTIDGTAGVNKANFGINVTGNSALNCTSPAASGYAYITNCDVGLGASSGGQISGTSNNQYAGNTANETAVAASYGYID